MELTRRESLNPDFVHRLTRIQTARMCRFCLYTCERTLINILDDEHLQMLIAECYHGCLGTLTGNASRFVCTNCYQRLEHSYEFLLHASRVQALVDTYTFHDGNWPQQSGMTKANVRQGEKRVATPEEDTPPMKIRYKKVRFEQIGEEDDLQIGEPTSSIVSDRCATPRPFNESFNDSVHDKSAASLETTLSGEIPGSELFQFSTSSSIGSESSPASDDNCRRARMESAVAKSTKLGEAGKDLSMVQNLCMQIEAIGVGQTNRRSAKAKISLAESDNRHK